MKSSSCNKRIPRYDAIKFGNNSEILEDFDSYNHENSRSGKLAWHEINKKNQKLKIIIELHTSEILLLKKREVSHF